LHLPCWMRWPAEKRIAGRILNVFGRSLGHPSLTKVTITTDFKGDATNASEFVRSYRALVRLLQHLPRCWPAKQPTVSQQQSDLRSDQQSTALQSLASFGGGWKAYTLRRLPQLVWRDRKLMKTSPRAYHGTGIPQHPASTVTHETYLLAGSELRPTLLRQFYLQFVIHRVNNISHALDFPKHSQRWCAIPVRKTVAMSAAAPASFKLEVGS